jgi:hypothetical protein
VPNTAEETQETQESSSDQLKILTDAVEETRKSIETAIASMHSLGAHDNSKDLAPEYKEEYYSSITLLTDEIRFFWNDIVCAYLDPAPLEPESRSPSPLLDLLHISNTNASISPPPNRGYRIISADIISLLGFRRVLSASVRMVIKTSSPVLRVPCPHALLSFITMFLSCSVVPPLNR